MNLLAVLAATVLYLSVGAEKVKPELAEGPSDAIPIDSSFNLGHDGLS